MILRFCRFVSVAFASVAWVMPVSSAIAAPAASTSPSGMLHRKVSYPLYVQQQVAAELARLEEDHDYPAATSALQTLFDQAVLYAPDNNPDCIRQTDFARRLVDQLQRISPEMRDQLLPFLCKHDELARTLVFLIRPDREGPEKIYALLNKLRTERPDQLDTYAQLAAALCVVQQTPFQEGLNEYRATSVDPISIFDYYVRHENQMFFGIRNVPAELLMYLVDTTASIDELEWALNRYAGTQDVGKLFFTIKYDDSYLQTGASKTLADNGFSLQNILKYGGVCVDQAYFATTVGKAIGVPTAIDRGMSAKVGHAWVGVLQSNGREAFWNFDTARYQDYQDVRGSVIDPRTHREVPDCYVTLLSQIIGTRTLDRQNAEALTDAAARLGELKTERDADGVAAPPVDAVATSTFLARTRSRDVDAQLALIESALRQSVACMPAWLMVRDLAVEKKLSLEQKQRWSDVLLRLGAAKYPDFTLSVLMPMVKSVDDPQQQHALLTNLLSIFAARKDLSAMIEMTQASLWESQQQPDLAGQCYMDVVDRYTNTGPFVLAALQGAEKLLENTNRADKVVLLYAQAWARTTKPDDEGQNFISDSTWFRIGRMYATKLTEAGNTQKAGEVNAALGIKPDSAAGR